MDYDEFDIRTSDKSIARKILELLKEKPITSEEIVFKLKISKLVILEVLNQLEIDGCVASVSQGELTYVGLRKNKRQ